MPTFTVSETAAKPYVSRRKRRGYKSKSKSSSQSDARSSFWTMGLLGLLILTLITSLGVIAAQWAS